MLTIKSDDVQGRAMTYESIINGERIKAPNIPASFNVLTSELKGLALNIIINEKKRPGDTQFQKGVGEDRRMAVEERQEAMNQK